jgi:hypothetical protein
MLCHVGRGTEMGAGLVLLDQFEYIAVERPLRLPIPRSWPLGLLVIGKPNIGSRE